MVLVIALPDLAVKLAKFLHNVEYVVQVQDGKDLRHQVYSRQPDVVVLDWRMGGSLWRAVDEVPAIVERTGSHPHVVALLPRVTREVKKEAAKLGCYDVVNADASGVARRVAESVELAQESRARRKVERRRVSRGDLH